MKDDPLGGVYTPVATHTSSPASARASADCTFWNAFAHVSPSPPAGAIAFT
ncbi:MAG: hypothetical protein AB7V21_07565 [Phycisphaerales bacterium]